MRFTILADDRKEVRAKLEELTGERAAYTRMPRCAFILRGIAVEKNGEVTTEEGADMELIRKLIEARLISDAVEETEPSGEGETEENTEADQSEGQVLEQEEPAVE